MPGGDGAILYATLDPWPSKQAMCTLLREAGLTIRDGAYSIRVLDFDDCTFREYGGDLGPPSLTATHDTAQDLYREAQQLSKIFTAAGIAHALEIYDEADTLFATLPDPAK